MSGIKSLACGNILTLLNIEALVRICTTLAEMSDLSFRGNCQKLG